MKTLLKCLAFALIALAAHAQQPTTPLATPIKTAIVPDSSLMNSRVKISLKDGTDLIGILQSMSGQNIFLKSDNIGEITVDMANVVSIKKIEGINVNGQFWFENPNSTRYFWAPSAFSLRKREAYYQNAYVVVNSVTVGVTDNFTMGGGLVLIPGGGISRTPQVLFFTPKYSFPSKSKVKFGIGTIAVVTFTPNYNFSSSYSGSLTRTSTDVNLTGIVYGNVTFGTKEKNFTAGLGYGFLNGSFASSPVINLSYMNRFSKNFAFVSENWIIVANNTTGGIFSGGIRILGERLSVDLALLAPAFEGIGDFYYFPYVGAVYKFGKLK